MNDDPSEMSPERKSRDLERYQKLLNGARSLFDAQEAYVARGDKVMDEPLDEFESNTNSDVARLDVVPPEDSVLSRLGYGRIAYSHQPAVYQDDKMLMGETIGVISYEKDGEIKDNFVIEDKGDAISIEIPPSDSSFSDTDKQKAIAMYLSGDYSDADGDPAFKPVSFQQELILESLIDHSRTCLTFNN